MPKPAVRDFPARYVEVLQGIALSSENNVQQQHPPN